MKIGLIDVDSHNFPNLALMKISAWHKQQGDTVEWCNLFKHYDRVYQSKVFDDTYTPDLEYIPNADEIIKGGTGYDLDNILPVEIEHCYPDYSLYPELTKDTAFGFLTRGCPRACDAIIVDKTFGHDDLFNAAACLSVAEVAAYCINKEIFGWHISDLVIYDKPKELSEFMVIDKDMLKECPYRERICQNPEYCNGNYLLGGYSCNKVKEPEFDDIDFCKGGCSDVFKPLTRPPQSWCYVEVE